MTYNWASRAPTGRRAAIFCADAAAYPLAEAIGRKIAAQEPDLDVVVCIEDRAVIPDRFLTDSPLRYVELDLDPRHYDLRQTEAISRMSYARLYLPAQIGQDYDRYLYLDADLLPLRPGLSRLVDADINPGEVAAVVDLPIFLDPPDDLRQSDRNAGVMLVDTTGSGASDMFADALAYAHAAGAALPLMDQTALNEACKGAFRLLSPRWNFFHTAELLRHQDLVDPHVLHFFAYHKPWLHTHVPARMAFYDTFQQLLRSAFTEAELARLPLWGVGEGRSAKFKNPVLAALWAWNRRRNIRRSYDAKVKNTPVTEATIQRILDEADVA